MREMQFKIQEMIFVTFLVLINHEVKMHIKHFFNKTNKKTQFSKRGINTILKLLLNKILNKNMGWVSLNRGYLHKSNAIGFTQK